MWLWKRSLNACSWSSALEGGCQDGGYYAFSTVRVGAGWTGWAGLDGLARRLQAGARRKSISASV